MIVPAARSMWLVCYSVVCYNYDVYLVILCSSYLLHAVFLKSCALRLWPFLDYCTCYLFVSELTCNGRAHRGSSGGFRGFALTVLNWFIYILLCADPLRE